jgi:hypothetical protein
LAGLVTENGEDDEWSNTEQNRGEKITCVLHIDLFIGADIIVGVNIPEHEIRCGETE